MNNRIFSTHIKLLILCCIIAYCSTGWSSGALELLHSIQSSSLLALDSKDNILYSKNSSEPFIPASTVKVLTALIALEHWGKNHRFSTAFYLERNENILWIKGYGDPYLISEELDIITNKIKLAGISELDGIGTDSNFYENAISIDGKQNSLNPYDAPVSALAANFNTVNVRVYSDSISSREKQTPLTPIAESLAQGLGIGTHRINLGNARYGAKYFSELLKAKLNRSKVLTSPVYLHGSIPANAELLFVHKNSHTLEQIIESMLKYSNNFIANLLYLNLGVEKHNAPANLQKSISVVSTYIDNNFNWSNYNLTDGAGLSRKNRLSATQLVDILKVFKPYRYLMPAQNNFIYAKSGTMKNISTYAGYLKRENDWTPFALMINDTVNFSFRENVANELLP